MAQHERLREIDPGLRGRRVQLKERVRQSIESGEAMRVTDELIRIPTVVHVVWRTDEENISDEQVTSQVEALNRDFRARNENQSNVPAVWQGLIADAKIEFELARRTRRAIPPTGSLAPRRSATPSASRTTRSRPVWVAGSLPGRPIAT